MKVSAILPALPLQATIAELRAASSSSKLYISQRSVETSEEIDPELLSEAWNHIVRVHEALRSEVVEGDGQWVVAVFDSPKSSTLEQLMTGRLDKSQTMQVQNELEQRHLSSLQMQDAPAILLGHLHQPGRSVLVLTWRHELLDGVAISTVLRDLESMITGSTLVDSESRLVHATRALRALPEISDGGLASVSPALNLTIFDTEVSELRLDSALAIPKGVLADAARSLGVTQSAAATAAFVGGLTDLLGSPAVVATAEDFRPSGHRGIPGAFTGVDISWHPQRTVTQAVLAKELHQHRARLLGRRPRGLIDSLRPLWDAGARGVPDCLLTVHGNESGPGGNEWRFIDAIERTEFALSIDVMIETGQVMIHRDPARVPPDFAEALADRATMRLYDDGIVALLRDADTATRTTVSSSASGKIEQVVSSAQRVLADPGITPDTDLLTESRMDSLDAMRLAVSLTDGGLATSVRTILTHRCPRHIAAASANEPQVAEGSLVSASALEESLLDRTDRHYCGQSPMHEQSLMMFGIQIDPGILSQAIRKVADEIEALSSVWSPVGDGGIVASRVNDLIVCDVSDDEILDSATTVLREDLERGFTPGDCLFRSFLFVGETLSGLATSWHNAVLDGWSGAALVLKLQAAYQQLKSSEGAVVRVRSSPVSSYRSWALSNPGDPEWWDTQLADAALGQPTAEKGRHVERMRSQKRQLPQLKNGLDTKATRSTTLVTAFGHTLQRVTEADSRRPIGVRMNMRPAELKDSTGMIGMITFEVPVIMRPIIGLADADNVSTALNGARIHGHMGERGVRSSCAWPDSHDLFDLLVVPELENPHDELIARGAGLSVWPLLHEWRREVSPSLITAYLFDESDFPAFRLSAVGFTAPEIEELADRFEAEFEKIAS